MIDSREDGGSSGCLYLVIACVVITIPFLIYRFLVLERLSQVLSE